MASLITQNLHRLRLLSSARIFYAYSAYIHRSPYRNARIFGFGEDEDSETFLESLYEAHNHLVSAVGLSEYGDIPYDLPGSFPVINSNDVLEPNTVLKSSVSLEKDTDGSCRHDLESGYVDIREEAVKEEAILVVEPIPDSKEGTLSCSEAVRPLDALLQLHIANETAKLVLQNEQLTESEGAPDQRLQLPADNALHMSIATETAEIVAQKQLTEIENILDLKLQTIADGDMLISDIDELKIIDSAFQNAESSQVFAISASQVPEDTKDVKIGTLIALLAPEGEDWKSVTVPAGDGAEEVAPVAAPSAPTAAAVMSSHGHGNYGPSVRLLLEQYGLTEDQVPHGGPHGILVKGDVLKLIKEKNLVPKSLAPVPPPAAPKPAVAATLPPPPKTIPGVSEDGYEDIEVTNIRRVIAKRLTQSKSGIAHSYGTLECRSDKLIALRKQYKLEGINVSINDILIKAVAVALTQCPEMNCVWQGEKLLMADEVDISIAVATPAGLITPIIRGAESIGIEEIASQVRDLAGRAKANKLKPEEFQGGTFTISNLGMFGISEFSAIINPPQCGILAVGGSRLSFDESGQPATYMSATLSYDRGGVDDDTAAHFLNILKTILENPTTMMIGFHATVQHPLAALL